MMKRIFGELELGADCACAGRWTAQAQITARSERRNDLIDWKWAGLRGTVALMTCDHLPMSLSHRIADSMDPAAMGYGFGLGFAVRRQDGIAAMAGSAGDYYWSGVYGTYFWVDPKEALVVVFMAAAPGLIRLRYRQMLRNLVYQALI